MPEMIPVGNTIVPPDPSKGLGLLSGIIGVQRQRQQLQTGQYQQQSAAAEAQQQQLTAGQQQGVQNFFSSWDPSAHIADDGTTDIESALKSNEYQSAGNAKPGIMQALLDIKQKQLTNKQSLATLDAGLLTQLGSQVGAAAKDDDVISDTTDPDTGVNAGRAKVKQIFDNFSKLSPEAARVSRIYGPMVENAPSGKLNAGVEALQKQALSVAEQLPKPTAVGAGASTQLYNVGPEGFTKGQQPVASTPYVPPAGVAPGPGGGLQRYGPGGAGLPEAGAAGPWNQPPVTSRLPALQQPGSNEPTAKWDIYKSQLKANSDLVTVARTAASDPVTGVQATRFNNQQIMDLAPHITSGPGMHILNTIASRLPQNARTSADDYQNVAHYMALNSAAMAQKMGVPNTNLGQETAAAAAGSVERNPATIQEITRTNDALNTGFDLFNRGLAAVSNNGSDPSRVGAYQQEFGKNMDVTALRWADAHRRGDKEEISELQKRPGFNLKQIQQHLRVLKSLADTGDLPQ